MKLSEHRRAFIQGHFAQSNKLDGCEVENPYLSTSNSSDAFWLGVKAAREGKPTNTPIHKSRGYTWIMDGVKYMVEGERIRQMQDARFLPRLSATQSTTGAHT